MKRFAMLIEDPEIGQVVVMQQRGDEGPEIAIYFDPGIDGMGVCNTNIGFNDDEDGWDKADCAFERFDDDMAVNMARKGIESIKAMFNEEAA